MVPHIASGAMGTLLYIPRDFLMAISNPESSGVSTATLPSPDQRSDSDVVIYDGNCRFCTAQVQRLAHWDGQGVLAYLSLHDPVVAERFPDLTHEMMMEQMYVVDRQGRRYGGSDALRYLSRRLRGLWWLAPLLHVPGTGRLWHWLYRQVANRRYRLAGQTCDGDTCRVRAP